jgi:hypothetical protein
VRDPLRPKLITNRQPLIKINQTSISIHISIFNLRPYINNPSIYYKPQLAMWLHYWHTQTQIWIEIAMEGWVKMDKD